MRVCTNVGHRLTRRLAKYLGAGTNKAVGTDNPNGFNGNLPSVNDAMGISDASGTVSFRHTEVTTQTFIVWYWSLCLNTAFPAMGWSKMGPDNTVYQLAVERDATGTFTIDPNTPFFITAVAEVTELFIGGGKHYDGNTHPDL